MKAIDVCKKTLLQQARDRVGLALTLLTAPLFVFLYWLAFPASEPPVDVCFRGVDTATVERIAGLLEEARPPVEITSCDQNADIVVTAKGLAAASKSTAPVALSFEGDATDPRFRAGVPVVERAIDYHVAALRGERPRIEATVEDRAGSASRSPFDLYVPNLVIFAVIMLVFSSAMSLAREVERGTLERLRLTRMRTGDYLAGMALAQACLGAGSIALTFATAAAVGFEAAGSVILGAGVALLTGVSCIGIGTFVASFVRSVAQAFVVASSFMFLLVLFSGIVFPIPDYVAFEALPTVHSVRAMHEILVLGASAGEVKEGIGAIVGLSAAFFVVGWWRFRRLHQSFVSGGPS